MKLYNQNIDKIENRKTIPTQDGTLYPNKLTDEQLNSYGYYRVKYESAPNRRYYTAEKTASVVGSEYVVGYTAVEKDLYSVKQAMAKDLFEYADKKEEDMEVETSLGIRVKGNAAALQAFQLGSKKSAKKIRDKNYQAHTVTKTQIDKILQEIEDNAVLFFETKGNKFDEIMALPDIAACMNYEREPYEYTITQEDVDNDIDGTIAVGDVVTRYRNKVKEW